MTFESLLKRHASDIAIVLGNGINRYNSASTKNSWVDLLNVLAKRHTVTPHIDIPQGISLTEFYDILDLSLEDSLPSTTLQQEFCDLLATWKPNIHHHKIVHWAREHKVPILTTNFDETLSTAAQCNLHFAQRDAFTDYYPWNAYFSDAQLSDPTAAFAVWHINGMAHYQRSLRLGLTHYMGSVERARRLIHRSKEHSLFSGKDVRNWKGANTWLHIVFNKPLLIVGLGLEESEVFLRWLLIERARYFRKYPDRRKKAWFFFVDDKRNVGKLHFLKGVGIEPIRVSKYSELYETNSWS